jgi:hypothetical protein
MASWLRVVGPAAWFTLMLAMIIAGPAPADEPATTDVRVLIDISGSMRQNDPDNLRRPALRMLSGLLQPGTQAGVWTFARWVNNLVPVGEVDEAWKERTQSVSQQISSPGQFTNIEEVLDKASADWTAPDPQQARHLILLTDGMVDVSKTPGESEASRGRIVAELLPRLKAAGAQVHTIALSERADHALMQQLSGETGGWYQQVEQAADLQRVFLRMFEKVGEPDTVPLDDNRFVVDGAVDEATVLAFSKPGSPPATLTSPSGEVFSDSDLPSGVAWYRDEGYDMITIDSPEKGEWVLGADLDPDNRVLIVTDLRLRTSEIPTHIAAGDETRIEASLNNRGEVVTRKAFLRLLDVSAVAEGAEGIGRLTLNDAGESPDEQAADGRYSMLFGIAQPADDVELSVTVESPTFMREKRFRLVVHDVADASIDDSAGDPVLRIVAERAVMQDGATVDAWQETASGERSDLDVGIETDGTWAAPLRDSSVPSYFSILGTTRLGTPVEQTFGPFLPEGVTLPEPVVPVAEAPPGPVDSEEVTSQPAEPAAEPEPQAVPVEPPPVEVEVADESAQWVMPAVMFGAFNLLLIIGGIVWFVIKRRGGKTTDALLDDMLEHVADEPAPSGAQEKAA